MNKQGEIFFHFEDWNLFPKELAPQKKKTRIKSGTNMKKPTRKCMCQDPVMQLQESKNEMTNS